MSVRDDIDEARRTWRVYAAIDEAYQRATTAQVRAALNAERLAAFERVPESYARGRCHIDHAPPSTVDALAIAGWCDQRIEALRGEP